MLFGFISGERCGRRGWTLRTKGRTRWLLRTGRRSGPTAGRGRAARGPVVVSRKRVSQEKMSLAHARLAHR